MSEKDLKQLIADWLDGHIGEEDSQRLQQQLRDSPQARELFRSYTKLDGVLYELALEATDTGETQDALPSSLRSSASVSSAGWIDGTRLAIAATLMLAVGGLAYQLGRKNVANSDAKSLAQQNLAQPDDAESSGERTIAGYATLRRVAGVRWSGDSNTYREGDVLPAGILEFDDGIAEIDFFCGATLIVEGPAKMELESDWSVRMLAGRLRANVPPAARGFIVKAADSEIIDLGTEFALEVAPENVRLEVVDGEVKLRGGRHDGEHLVTGEGQSLLGNGRGESLKNLSTIGDVQRRRKSGQKERFDAWKAHSNQLRSDDRLIAYYPIADSASDRFVPNAARSGSESDGTLVGTVNRVDGRFGPDSSGLEFDRPGARLRTLIDGTFQAFTFVCWVKIDNLEHKYNALFMGDGYENGEPHWQIRDDGRLMFSVMVDDTQDIKVTSAMDQKIVSDAGLHRVYFTEPFWDISKSGQWFHIAVTYDPAARLVSQYINGQTISSEEIIDRYFIDELRIGPAEIGNWGQPFRKTPWFAVRNLNGAIDELAIFDAALSPTEIETLYEQGKPLGY